MTNSVQICTLSQNKLSIYLVFSIIVEMPRVDKFVS